jgi:hypothetical protein
VRTDNYDVTPRDVEAARAEAARLEAAWRQEKFVVIHAAAVNKQQAAVEVLATRYWQWRNELASRRKGLRRHEGLARGLRRSLRFWAAWQSSAPAVWIGVAGLVLTLILGGCAGVAVKAALGLLACLFACCLTALAFVVWYQTREEWAGKKVVAVRVSLREAEGYLGTAEALVSEAEGAVGGVRQAWEQAQQSLKRMERLRSLSESYEVARREYERLPKVTQSRLYALAHCNWRDLRGTPFEDFLRQVFEALGYTVQTTKASGDQGIDLILTGKGRRIGVQAKGYSGNIGNHAVMEAYAGMKFYGCDSCVVVTNSDFTRQAREMAQRTGCGLIAGQQIPSLIRGEIRL